MKLLFMIRNTFTQASTLGLITILIASTGCAPKDQRVETSAPLSDSFNVTIVPGDTIHLTVWGMSCPKCVTNVDQLLYRVEGVTGVETDMSSGLVTVSTGSQAPNGEALRNAIVQAGFTPMGIKVLENKQ